jgi:hypothetical protein
METVSVPTIYENRGDIEKQKEFLEYFTKPNKNQYNRQECAYAVGITLGEAEKWFKKKPFLDRLERHLKRVLVDKSRIKETLIESAIAIASASVADCFGTDPISGENYPLPLKDIPRATQAAIQQYKVMRVRVPGDDGRMEYRDVLDIKLLDKVNAIRLLGEWVDIKSDEKKRLESKTDRILGLTIITGDDSPKEIGYEVKQGATQKPDSNGSLGEVQLHEEADSRIEETWIGE